MIQVLINGKIVDFNDLRNFPVSITKEMDTFTDIYGSTGSTTQNVIRDLVLPATTRNLEVIYGAWNQNNQNSSGIGRAKMTLQIIINGAVTFSGSCILKTAIRNGETPQSITLETLGDGLNIWEQLEGVSLRDLDIGSVEWSNNTIVDTNQYQYPAYNCIFAPVIYGATHGSAGTSPWTGIRFDTLDFRPSIYFRAIVKAIFETYIGYKIESQFLDSAYFAEWVYMFGVGNDWKLYAPVSKCEFSAKRSPNPMTLPALGNPHVIALDTVVDPMNAWDALNYKYVIPYTGLWEFNFSFEGTNIDTYRLRIIDPVATNDTVYGIFGDYAYIVVTTLSPTLVGQNIYLKHHCRAGARVYLEVLTNGNGTGEITPEVTYLRGKLIDQIIPESDISLASCLHDKPAKDFIKAITHQFNLVWFVNNVTRRVFCEPRFDYRLWNDTQTAIEWYDGWYSSPKSTDEPVYTAKNKMAMDINTIELQVVQPYGKFIRMQYQDDSDPLLEYYKKRKPSEILPYGFQMNDVDRGAEGTVLENPLFGPLFCGWSTQIQSYGYYMPIVLPSGISVDESIMVLDNTGEIVGDIQAIEATHSSGPKCGMLYRNLINLEWESGDFAGADYALIQQHNVIKYNYGFANNMMWSGAYANVIDRWNIIDPISPTKETQKAMGLIESFHYQWLSCLRNGQMIKAKFNITSLFVSQEQFRLRKYLQIGAANIAPWVLLKINNFQPTLAELTECWLIRYWAPTRADFTQLNTDDTPIIHNDTSSQPLTHNNPL